MENTKLEGTPSSVPLSHSLTYHYLQKCILHSHTLEPKVNILRLKIYAVNLYQILLFLLLDTIINKLLLILGERSKNQTNRGSRDISYQDLCKNCALKMPKLILWVVG